MQALPLISSSFGTKSELVNQTLLEQTAADLGIHLLKRLPGLTIESIQPTKPETYTAFNGKRKVVDYNDETDFLSDNGSAPRTPKKSRRPSFIPETPKGCIDVDAEDGLLTPPPSIKASSQQSVTISERPRDLTFSAWSNQPRGSNWNEEGFRDSAFINPSPALPLDSQSSEYRNKAMRQVTSTSTTQQYNPTASKNLPRVGFRAFSRESQGINSIDGFVAGMFINVSRIPPPPECPYSPYYQHEALRHIAPLHSGPTPLVSVTWSLVRAIHRALKIGPHSSIAIIDLYEADRGGTVQSAVKLNLKPDHFYTANGEFLCWGGIAKESIVSIVRLPDLLASMPTMPADKDPFRIETLRASKRLGPARRSILEDRLPMSYFSGQAVGKLLNLLSISAKSELFEYTVYSVIKDWRFRGIYAEWQKNTIFANGVEQGYRSILNQCAIGLDLGEDSKFAKYLKEQRDADHSYNMRRDDQCTANKGTSIGDFVLDMRQYIDFSDSEIDDPRESSISMIPRENVEDHGMIVSERKIALQPTRELSAHKTSDSPNDRAQVWHSIAEVLPMVPRSESQKGSGQKRQKTPDQYLWTGM